MIYNNLAQYYKHPVPPDIEMYVPLVCTGNMVHRHNHTDSMRP